MSIIGDSVAALKNVLLMQANLERMERQLEKLDDTQDGFREAMFRLSERLTRVESVLFDSEARARQAAPVPPALPEA